MGVGGTQAPGGDAAGEQENLSGPGRSKEEVHDAMVALAGPGTVAQVQVCVVAEWPLRPSPGVDMN
jgi:hypothetical protein